MASPENKIRFGGWSHNAWAEVRTRIRRFVNGDEDIAPRRLKKKRGNKKCRSQGHILVLVPPMGEANHTHDGKVQYLANLFGKPGFGGRADVYVCSRCSKIEIEWNRGIE